MTDRLEPTTRDNCGTRNGYKRHTRAGERACVPCADASNLYRRRRLAAKPGARVRYVEADLLRRVMAETRDERIRHEVAHLLGLEAA